MDDFTSFCRFLCFFFFFLFPKSKKGADIKMAQEEEEGSCVVGGLFDDQDFYVEPPKFFMKEYHFNEFCGHQCAPLLEVEFKDAPPMKREKNKEEKKGKTLELRLVGSHPLWGHTLSNAGMVVSNMMKGEQIHVLKSQDHPKLFPLLSCSSERCCPSSRTFLDVEGKRILELGAGAAVPSLVGILCGAESAVISDYSDSDLVENMKFNVSNCLPPSLQSKAGVCGYIWGQDTSELLKTCVDDVSATFDIIILADLLFNHSEHKLLLQTCQQCLSPGGQVIVAFSHHLPQNEEKDLQFLRLAVEPPFEFKLERLFSTRTQVMFPEDTGNVEIRSKVEIQESTKENERIR